MTQSRAEFSQALSAARTMFDKGDYLEFEDAIRVLSKSVTTQDEFREYLELLYTHGRGLPTEYDEAREYLGALWGNMSQNAVHYKELEAAKSPWAAIASALLNAMTYE